MNNTIKLIIEYQKYPDSYIFEELVLIFNDIFKFNLKKVSNNDKFDLYQELLIGFEKLIKEFKLRNNNIINNDIFTLDNLCKYKSKGVNYIKEECEIEYLDGFIDKYQDTLFIDAFKNKESKELFIYEYNLFCNENQFIKRLMLRMESLRINFIKKNRIKINNDIILIDYQNNKLEYNDKILNQKEIDFLNLFYEKEKILTEQQVADKLGITQQAVNKRKKKIYKKIKI